MSSATQSRVADDAKESLGNRVKNGVVEAVFRSALFLFAILPRRLVRVLSTGLGRLVWHLKTTGRRITEINLAIAFPELSEPERDSLAKTSFLNLFWYSAELGCTWGWSADRSLKCISSIRGEELLQTAVADGGGVLMLLPHIGNWELVGSYLATQAPTTGLYKEPRVAGIREPVKEARERNGNHLVPAGARGVRALLKALKSGELAAVLPDHVPTMGGGEFAPFFGEPALTMTLVTKLIGRTNCTALFAYATYLPDNSYELVIRPADEDIYSPDSAVSLAALNKSVEDCIRDRPEHYRWEYKRFRFLPDFTRRKSY